jgi:hypothetical protein
MGSKLTLNFSHTLDICCSNRMVNSENEYKILKTIRIDDTLYQVSIADILDEKHEVIGTVFFYLFKTTKLFL